MRSDVPLKILFLADADSVHTWRWATALSRKGFQIGIFSLRIPSALVYPSELAIQIDSPVIGRHKPGASASTFSKLSYVMAMTRLRKLVKEFKPDIVHAHYASSYGLLGSLLGYKPFVLSVWGSDVFDFPRNSPFHKLVFKYNLKKANRILSTSHVMAIEIGKYSSRPVNVIPFGVDLNHFKPGPAVSIFEKDDVVIGTIKSLEKVYGIEYLIRAFIILKKNHPEIPLKLLLVGDGSQHEVLEKLCADEDIANDVFFAGQQSLSKLPQYHNRIDIFAALSLSESFGVAVIEASASEKPVVVSRVGGLPEVVVENETGFIVPAQDPEAAAAAIGKLLIDVEKRKSFGTAGRKFVIKNYAWEACVQKAENVYRSFSIGGNID